MTNERCRHEWDSSRFPPICTRCGGRAIASPSQAETWVGCQRKWAYSRSSDFPRKQWPAAIFGDHVHRIREAWLALAIPPDLSIKEGRCAAQGLERLPRPGTALVEHEATMFVDRTGRHASPGEGVVEYRPRIDVVCNYLPAISVEIIDHKTILDPTKIKRADVLLGDGQRIIYAEWAAHTYQVPIVHARWEYLLRDASYSEAVWCSEDADAIRDRFVDLHTRVVLPMVEANGRPIESFPRSLDYCDRFGPCPYLTDCHRELLDSESFDTITGTSPEKNMSDNHLPPLTIPASALPTGFPGYLPPPVALQFAPEIEQWIATFSPDQHARKRIEALAAGHKPIDAPPAEAPLPTLSLAPPPAAPPVQPAAPVVQPAAPVVQPHPIAVAPSPPVAPLKRGRPAKASGVKLLEQCAAGGQTPDSTEWYLGKLAELEAG